MATKLRQLLLVVLVVWVASASATFAQGTVNVTATDPATGARDDVGGTDAATLTSGRIGVVNLSFLFGWDGTTWSRVEVSNGRIKGLFDCNNCSATTGINSSVVEGPVVHGSAYASTIQPVLTGGYAMAFGTNPTAVDASTAARTITNRAQVPFVLGGHPNIVTREAQIEDADGAQSNAAIVTVATGLKIVVTQVYASCDGSTTNPTNIVVGFGAATIPARAAGGTTGILAAFDGLSPGRDMSRGDGSGIIGIGADDEDVRITTEDPAGGNCSVTVSYFTIES